MSIPEMAARAAEAAFMETLVELRLAEGGGFKVASQQRRAIRAALEAAAPHMLAEAWAEGREAGYSGWDNYKDIGDVENPYTPAS